MTTIVDNLCAQIIWALQYNRKPLTKRDIAIQLGIVPGKYNPVYNNLNYAMKKLQRAGRIEKIESEFYYVYWRLTNGTQI